MTTTERVGTTDNIAVVRRVFDEVINEGRLETAHEITKPDAPVHAPFDDPGAGPEALAKIASSLRTGFPDIHIEVEDIFAAEDKVVVR